MIEQLLGWLGTIGLLSGAFLLFGKKTAGFLAYSVGAIFYFAQGVLMCNWPLVFLNMVFFMMNLSSWFIWRRKSDE